MMIKKSYKIYLFRHGRTIFNEKGIFSGWKDAKLSWRGKKDAMKIAKKMRNKKFQVAIQTKLSRSKDTLRAVLKNHPECRKTITDNRMIERSYGVLEGTSHEQFVKRIGKQEVNLRIEGDALGDLNPNQRKKIERFLGEKEYEVIHRGYNIALPKGESFKDVEKRVGKFIKWLKTYIKKNKVNVAISAHGNSIRIFKKIWENRGEDEAIKWFIPYDVVFTYEVKA